MNPVFAKTCMPLRDGEAIVSSLSGWSIEHLLDEAEQHGLCAIAADDNQRRRLARRVESGELVNPHPGLYIRADVWNGLNPTKRKRARKWPKNNAATSRGGIGLLGGGRRLLLGGRRLGTSVRRQHVPDKLLYFAACTLGQEGYEKLDLMGIGNDFARTHGNDPAQAP